MEVKLNEIIENYKKVISEIDEEAINEQNSIIDLDIKRIDEEKENLDKRIGQIQKEIDALIGLPNFYDYREQIEEKENQIALVNKYKGEQIQKQEKLEADKQKNMDKIEEKGQAFDKSIEEAEKMIKEANDKIDNQIKELEAKKELYGVNNQLTQEERKAIEPIDKEIKELLKEKETNNIKFKKFKMLLEKARQSTLLETETKKEPEEKKPPEVKKEVGKKEEHEDKKEPGIKKEVKEKEEPVVKKAPKAKIIIEEEPEAKNKHVVNKVPKVKTVIKEKEKPEEEKKTEVKETSKVEKNPEVKKVSEEQKEDEVLKKYKSEGFGQNALGWYFNPWKDEYDEEYDPHNDAEYNSNINSKEKNSKDIKEAEQIKKEEDLAWKEYEKQNEQTERKVTTEEIKAVNKWLNGEELEPQDEIMNIVFLAKEGKYKLVNADRDSKEDFEMSIEEINNSKEFSDFHDILFSMEQSTENIDKYLAFMFYQADNKWGTNKLENYINATNGKEKLSGNTEIYYEMEGIYGKQYDASVSNEIMKIANYHGDKELAKVEKNGWTKFLEKHDKLRSIIDNFRKVNSKAKERVFRKREDKKALKAADEKVENIKIEEKDVDESKGYRQSMRVDNETMQNIENVVEQNNQRNKEITAQEIKEVDNKRKEKVDNFELHIEGR